MFIFAAESPLVYPMNENTTHGVPELLHMCLCVAYSYVAARCAIPSLDPAGRLRGITRILMAGAYHGLFNSEIITGVSFWSLAWLSLRLKLARLISQNEDGFCVVPASNYPLFRHVIRRVLAYIKFD